MSNNISDELMESYKKSTEQFTISNNPYDIFKDFIEKLEMAKITVFPDNEVGIVTCMNKNGEQVSLTTKTLKAYGHALDKLGCLYAALNRVLFKLLMDGHNCISFRKNLSFDIVTHFEDETRECIAGIRYISGKDIDEHSFSNQVRKIVESRKYDIDSGSLDDE